MTELQIRKFSSAATLLVSKRRSSEHNYVGLVMSNANVLTTECQTVAVRCTVQQPSYTRQTNEAYIHIHTYIRLNYRRHMFTDWHLASNRNAEDL